MESQANADKIVRKLDAALVDEFMHGFAYGFGFMSQALDYDLDYSTIPLALHVSVHAGCKGYTYDGSDPEESISEFMKYIRHDLVRLTEALTVA